MGETPRSVPWRLQRSRKGSTEQSTIGARKNLGWRSVSRKKRHAAGQRAALASSSARCDARMASNDGRVSSVLLLALLALLPSLIALFVNKKEKLRESTSE